MNDKEQQALNYKPFYFMRHGETDYNLNGLNMGQTDIPLNDNGLRQAEEARLILQDVEFTSMAVSPLKRARQTAEIIARDREISISFIDELKEFALGAMEGKPKGDRSWIKKWQDGEVSSEGGESFTKFIQRVMQGLNKVWQAPEPVFIVAHGGVYGAISQVLRLPVISLSNCMIIYHEPPKHAEQAWLVRHINS